MAPVPGSEPDPASPALTALSKFAGQVLLVVSEHDSVVLPVATDAYRNAAANVDVNVLAGAQHNLNAETQLLFKPLVLEWASSL